MGSSSMILTGLPLAVSCGGLSKVLAGISKIGSPSSIQRMYPLLPVTHSIEYTKYPVYAPTWISQFDES
uniref:Uncharacterized protein n=1 Tax=Globisporangium ultimum (strain ATCC 200006 / CBS 805.95 / DAOM BR144) TaxID=431595 RepID=K3X0G5_GLOUD